MAITNEERLKDLEERVKNIEDALKNQVPAWIQITADKLRKELMEGKTNA